ncbi:ABC transporter permease [Zhaonella formicivorans]|uniref:ABC transporter permease n=1 Tax=Zhaonella formicivorans TaxID=2528593 RepID=UPI0010DF5A97|nr:ABC transporter permease [Zhaonella formicivorans]
MNRLVNIAKQSRVGTVLLLLFAWWLVAELVNKAVLPPPQEAFFSFFNALQKDLAMHLGVSLLRVVTSLALAFITAVPLGLFLGKNSRWDEILAPVIYLTYPIPKVVFMPVIFILLGIGNISKIVLIYLIVFYQILVVTRDSAKNLEQAYILSVQSLGANSWELYRHVFLPGCLPEILTSLRIGLGTAIAVLFLAETYATRTGIGYFIMDALSRLAYQEMFAGIIAMGTMGYVLYFILDKLHRFLCPWGNT